MFNEINVFFSLHSEATHGQSGIELINQISSDRKYLFNNTGIIMAN